MSIKDIYIFGSFPLSETIAGAWGRQSPNNGWRHNLNNAATMNDVISSWRYRLWFLIKEKNQKYIYLLLTRNIMQDTNVITTSTQPTHIPHFTEYTFTFDTIHQKGLSIVCSVHSQSVHVRIFCCQIIWWCEYVISLSVHNFIWKSLIGWIWIYSHSLLILIVNNGIYIIISIG